MPRWEANPQERLVQAALDLFSDLGYDNTTVAQIAERAGLTKSTVFRHFPDKREMLFAGQDLLSGLLADAIAGATADATVLQLIAAALDAVSAAFTPELRALGPQRQAAIAANAELREREAYKRAVFASVLADALAQRDVPEPVAAVAAQLGVLAFADAYARWIRPNARRSFGSLARTELDRLSAAVAAIT